MPNNLVVSPHPLLPAADRQYATVVWSAGDTIENIMEKADLTLPHNPVVVSINDQIIPRAKWSTVCPRADDVIYVRSTVHGGDDSNVLAIVAMVALTVFTMGAGAWSLAGMTGLTGTQLALAQAAVMIGGQFIINAVFPPAMPDLGNFAKNEVSPTYTLSAARNQPRLFAPMALVIGEHKVFPDLGAQPYTEFISNEQYLYQIFHFGLSDILLTDIKIGEDPNGTYLRITD